MCWSPSHIGAYCSSQGPQQQKVNFGWDIKVAFVLVVYSMFHELGLISATGSLEGWLQEL